jgi:ribonuclease HII
VTIGAALLTQSAWQSIQSASWQKRIKDSKLLSASRRAELAPLIAAAMPVAISHVSVAYIDKYNINRAIQKGIYRAAQQLISATDLQLGEIRVLIDGNYRFQYPAMGLTKPMPRLDAEIKADLNHFPVSAASIVAKVSRDRLIAAADGRFPEYGLAKHAGYGTQMHRDAIIRYGLTRFHRKSFKLRNG